jgi:hypothetical protein
MEIKFLRFLKKQSVHSFTSEQVLSQAVVGCIAGGDNSSPFNIPSWIPPSPMPLPSPINLLLPPSSPQTPSAPGTEFSGTIPTIGVNYPVTENFRIGGGVTITEHGVSAGGASFRWGF